MGVRKSSPQLVIYSLNCCCTYSPRISQRTASRAGWIKLEYFQAEQSYHMGRINLEPSQATASKHWSPHSVRVVIITYLSFFPLRPSTMSLLVQQYINNTHMLNLWDISWRSPCSNWWKRLGFFVGLDSLDTHRLAPAVSASPVASLAVCCPELSFEHSIWVLELVSLQPTPKYTHVIHARSRNQLGEPW